MLLLFLGFRVSFPKASAKVVLFLELTKYFRVFLMKNGKISAF